MTRETFWEIIALGAVEPDLEKRNAILINNLTAYPEEDIISFEIHLREVLDELDHFDIAGLLKIILGLVTDDSYLYFRCWIISNGQEFTLKLFEEGDSIVEKLPLMDLPSFEDMLYVTTLAYGNKIGNNNEDETFPRSIAGQKEGLNYDMDDGRTKGKRPSNAQMKKNFPKLWNLCRVNPPDGSAFDLMNKSGFYSGPSFS